MKTKKIVRDLTLVLVIVFLSTSILTPIRVQAIGVKGKESSQSESGVGHKNGQRLLAEIQNAINQLTAKQTSLENQMTSLVGVNTSSVQPFLTDLQKQIDGLKALQVPSNPTADDLKSINKSLMALRLGGWKDVTGAAKDLWKINHEHKMLQRLALQLQSNIKQTITNLTKRSENIKMRMNAKQAKGVDVTTIQTALNDLLSKIETIKAIVVPSNPVSTTEIKTLQSSYKTAREAGQKAAETVNKLLGSI